jgi:hypothetical protein
VTHKCGGGTVLVLEGCGPREAADTVISCNVGATALLLPDVAELLGRAHEPRSVKIARVGHTAVTAGFNSVAELVRLPVNAVSVASAARRCQALNQRASAGCTLCVLSVPGSLMAEPCHMKAEPCLQRLAVPKTAAAPMHHAVTERVFAQQVRLFADNHFVQGARHRHESDVEHLASRTLIEAAGRSAGQQKCRTQHIGMGCVLIAGSRWAEGRSLKGHC